MPTCERRKEIPAIFPLTSEEKNMDEARQIAMEEWVINFFLDNRRKEKKHDC